VAARDNTDTVRAHMPAHPPDLPAPSLAQAAWPYPAGLPAGPDPERPRAAGDPIPQAQPLRSTTSPEGDVPAPSRWRVTVMRG
jgi:hypothetical protein